MRGPSPVAVSGAAWAAPETLNLEAMRRVASLATQSRRVPLASYQTGDTALCVPVRLLSLAAIV